MATVTVPRNRGRLARPVDSFASHFCSDEKKRRELSGMPALTSTELNALMVNTWNAMPMEEKDAYVNRQELLATNENENSQKSGGSEDGEKRTRRPRQKKPKDPNAPKRALSSFFHFCQDQRAIVKGQNPDIGFKDVARLLGKMWAGMDEAAKAKYIAIAEADRNRYQEEMAVYGNQNQLA